MAKLIWHKWNDATVRWSENDLQSAVVQWLRRNGFDVAADMGGLRTSRRQASLAKQSGLIAGEPDLRIYLDGGRLLMVEMKTARGSVSKVQRERHAVLRGLGFDIEVLKAATPQDAVDKISAIMARYANQPPC
jgi:hypothetical protein